MCSKPHQHFKIYKPYGMISQMGSNNAKELRTKHFLKALYNFPEGIMPIGRLDENSEGLLLLTTDGKLSDTINRSGKEKEYYAQLDGEITADAIKNLRTGVEIGFEGKKYQTKQCVVTTLETPTTLPEPDKKIRLGRHRPTSWVRIVLTEGKFRQVRKMTAAVGFPTLRLIRVRVGTITLDGLLPGDVAAIADRLLYEPTK
ncbi:MAG: ribulose phosphate epimerase [Flavobacteriaceae bacterium]|nr:MAG: ribulose phosphate epimerase [Flavobacteriaceae bacterium]